MKAVNLNFHKCTKRPQYVLTCFNHSPPLVLHPEDREAYWLELLEVSSAIIANDFYWTEGKPTTPLLRKAP